MGKFNKGLLLGGLLGAGLVWMSTTKEGRKTKEQILDVAAELYCEVKKKIQSSDAWKNITESKYYTMVEDLAAEYKKKHGTPDAVVAMVIKVLKSQWKTLR